MTSKSYDIQTPVQAQDSFRHDLRTHISAIISLTDLIKKAPDLDNSSHLLDALHLAADNALAIMDGGIHKAVPPSDNPINLVHLLRDYDLLAKGLVQSCGARFSIEIGARLQDEPIVECDPVQLHRVLMLLLDNALNYARGANLHLSANLGDNKDIELLFCDNGPGFGDINPDILFLPYQRGAHHNPVKGSGLGLWSARNIMQAMGGTITARPNDPSGACFILKLPNQPSDITATQNEHQTGQNNEQRSHASGPSILIVDDNKTNHLILGELLTAMGCKNQHALSGRQALENLTDFRPDVILIDIRMPDMDGWELARRIKANPELATIPLLAISADAPSRHMKHFINWLHRPIRPTDISKAFKQLNLPGFTK